MIEAFETLVADRLVGLYVHGSLALGCFNSARSDVDVIAVVDEPLSGEEKLQLIDGLLRISAAPYAIELHVLARANLEPWRYPTPFDLHYGESHREDFAFDPLGALQAQADATDPDLAAHLSVVREAGVVLAGPVPADVFPEVSKDDLADSLRRDLEWTRNSRSALYAVLSPCRVWAALATGDVHSKASGARWALERLPDDLRPLVERALASYEGAGESIEFDEAARERLFAYVEDRVDSIAVSNAAT